ncbi:HAD family hydrolase [Fictibacillus phosphorivorans]|uniref:HAD family hydrolase n=1 Tax=Fictibacillus phosphorivorans TaxID=1221500 RepID=UPI00203EEF55|nr:HAD family phosphatase [Fictibacillus phosphorivorans]MCM3716840.1 HAD family phosphatase [Fictibacillus phosphorivorans]MCM3774611.1 HAD family phosphatase [Fictibacillus phosphorivorans]
MKFKAVCFDMDGVVVDTMHHHVEAWRYAFNQKGYDRNDLEFYLREGMPGRKTIMDVFNSSQLTVSEEDIEDIYIQKRKYFKENANYTFIKETLCVLKYLYTEGIPLSLVTGSRKEFVDEVLEKLPVSFDSVITGDDVKEGKPLPEPYLKAISNHSYSPSEWLVIENAPLGIESAKQAGAFCLAVETTLEKEYLASADEIVPPSQLEQTVKSYFK